MGSDFIYFGNIQKVLSLMPRAPLDGQYERDFQIIAAAKLKTKKITPGFNLNKTCVTQAWEYWNFRENRKNKLLSELNKYQKSK